MNRWLVKWFDGIRLRAAFVGPCDFFAVPGLAMAAGVMCHAVISVEALPDE